MKAVMEIKERKISIIIHYYAVHEGDDVAFPQSKNVFKYLCVCTESKHIFAYSVFFYCSAVPSHGV